MAKSGHDVTVVTGFPTPTGKVFAGYKNKLWQREEVAGIKVIWFGHISQEIKEHLDGL